MHSSSSSSSSSSSIVVVVVVVVVVVAAAATAVVVVMVVVVVAVVVLFIFFSLCLSIDITCAFLVTLWMHIINRNLGKIHLNCLNCCFYPNNFITYKHQQIFFYVFVCVKTRGIFNLTWCPGVGTGTFFC